LIRTSNPPGATGSSKSSFVIAVGVTIALLFFGRQIFIPIALALVLSFLLTPFVGWLQVVRFRRAPAVLTVMTLCIALMATVGWMVTGQLLEIMGHMDDYRANVEEKIQALRPHKGTPLTQATKTVQELNKELSNPAEIGKSSKNADGTPRAANPIPVQVTAPPANFVQELRAILGPLAGPMETAGMVIIFSTFMLIYREDLRNRLIRLGGQGQLTVMTQALEEASQGLSRYLMLQFLVNTCYGCLFGLGLYFIGVPRALLWGALGALLRFVPYVGTWIAAAFPIAMTIAVFPGWEHALLAFALFAVLELVTANLIEPWLYGQHTGISPLAILVAAVFWASLWGPVGLILSTPLTLCLILAGRYVPQMSFLEVLLGDEPALSPQELFYQRLLAMDPDEARNVAKKYLGDKSVQDLYESVLIPALRLSEEDRHMDFLGDRSAEFIAQTTRELIDDLADRDQSDSTEKVSQIEKTAPPRLAQRRVVCLPARDEADELVGMMLAQLLQRAGNRQATYLAINTVDHMLDEVERGGFEVACVSALPPFAVGQARSLCKRLHTRLPHLAIVVGLWGFAGGLPKAQERVGPSCTDAVATSLSEALLQIRRLMEMSATSGIETNQQSDPERSGTRAASG
jgi:predicted PurR-regulated permease PerM